MTDAVLKIVASPVTMTIRAPSVQRLTIAAPAPVRLTVKPRTSVGISVPKQGPPGPQGRPGQDGTPGPTGATGATPVENSYPVAVAAGQTIIPISPPPTDLNGLVLLVNGISYGPPNRITVSAVAVTWLGDFALDPTDDIRVVYF